MKLTQRGRFVVYTLLVAGVVASLFFSIYAITLVSNHVDSHTASITCVADTVLQADGSCTPVEV